MIKRASCNTWAKYFERHEGVRISHVTIRERLKQAGKIGEAGRTKIGRVLKNAFFSEWDVREVCADLLCPLPVADQAGFVEKDGVRYGTLPALSNLFGVTPPTIRVRIRSAGLMPIYARLFLTGNEVALYSEPAVRDLCEGFFGLPQVDPDGFANVDGVRHGSMVVIARSLGVSQDTIKSCIESLCLQAIRGKDRMGHPTDLYSEAMVRTALADHLDKSLPLIGPDGIAVVEGLRYGAVAALSRSLGVSISPINSRIRASGIRSIQGRDSENRHFDLYPEEEIRKLLGYLLGADVLQCDASGCVEIGGVRYAARSFLAQALDLNINSIAKSIKSRGLKFVKGRNPSGRIIGLYPEPAVREACKDLLEKRQSAIVNRKSDK